MVDVALGKSRYEADGKEKRPQFRSKVESIDGLPGQSTKISKKLYERCKENDTLKHLSDHIAQEDCSLVEINNTDFDCRQHPNEQSNVSRTLKPICLLSNHAQVLESADVLLNKSFHEGTPLTQSLTLCPSGSNNDYSSTLDSSTFSFNTKQGKTVHSKPLSLRESNVIFMWEDCEDEEAFSIDLDDQHTMIQPPPDISQW